MDNTKTMTERIIIHRVPDGAEVDLGFLNLSCVEYGLLTVPSI